MESPKTQQMYRRIEYVFVALFFIFALIKFCSEAEDDGYIEGYTDAYVELTGEEPWYIPDH